MLANQLSFLTTEELCSHANRLKLTLLFLRMINFILRMKLKVVLLLGTASIAVLIIATSLEMIQRLAFPKPEAPKLISEVIANDIVKVRLKNCTKPQTQKAQIT